MEEIYYVITNCDGDTYVTPYTKEELMEQINDGGIGCENDNRYITDLELAENRDTNYWGGTPLIIKGHVVSPKPVKVVEKFDIE